MNRYGYWQWSGRSYKEKIFDEDCHPIATLLLIANTINIGADVGAMSASVRLIFPQLHFVDNL
jgi:hypothetical protein